MSKKDTTNNKLSVQDKVFNSMLSLTDKLRDLTSGKDYAYSVRYNVYKKHFYIAKWIGNSEIVFHNTICKTPEEFVAHMQLMVNVLEDFTAVAHMDLEDPSDNEDNDHDEREFA